MLKDSSAFSGCFQEVCNFFAGTPLHLLIALLSAFLLLESMSSSAAFTWYLLRCSPESITWLAVWYVVLYWYTVTDLTTLWPFPLFRVWTDSSATCNIITAFFRWYEFVFSPCLPDDLYYSDMCQWNRWRWSFWRVWGWIGRSWVILGWVTKHPGGKELMQGQTVEYDLDVELNE